MGFADELAVEINAIREELEKLESILEMAQPISRYDEGDWQDALRNERRLRNTIAILQKRLNNLRLV